MKQFYTVKEVAEIYALSPSTVYDLTRRGRLDYLKPTRLGNTIRFLKTAVDSHINDLEAA